MINIFDEYGKNELLTTDVQFLGLTKKAWAFSRGARTERIYQYENQTTAIKDSYTYTLDSNNREITAILRKIEWFDDQGVLQLEKDISPDPNVKALKSLNREVRQGRIDYLEAAAEQLGAAAPYVPEPYATDFEEASNSIEILFKHYSTEIDNYIKRGSLEFEAAILAETNPILVKILSLESYIPDADFPTGLTIKQAIVYQLTGVKP